MNVNNTQAQMRKGVLEYCVLGILEHHSCYASDILDKLKAAELIVVEGTLYPLLTRLKNANLVDYRWEESPNGPPRKYYDLSADGKVFLQSLDATWDKLVNAVNESKK